MAKCSECGKKSHQTTRISKTFSTGDLSCEWVVELCNKCLIEKILLVSKDLDNEKDGLNGES